MSFVPSVLVVAVGIIANLAFATNTSSPLQPINQVCQSNGPVRVCRAQSKGAAAMLTIDYSGTLAQFDPVSVWVRLNSRVNTYKMRKVGNHASVFLTNGNIGCVPCSLAPEPDMLMCPSPAWVDQWICTEASPEIKDLFFWSVDSNGALNRWDIEVAFVSGSDWDSQFGRNYRFRLP